MSIQKTIPGKNIEERLEGLALVAVSEQALHLCRSVMTRVRPYVFGITRRRVGDFLLFGVTSVELGILEMAMKEPEIRFDTILSSEGIETIEKARRSKTR